MIKQKKYSTFAALIIAIAPLIFLIPDKAKSQLQPDTPLSTADASFIGEAAGNLRRQIKIKIYMQVKFLGQEQLNYAI